MVSGFKKDSTSKTGKKGKLVLAKDPKQAMLAIIVVCLFIGNTIYSIAKYYKEQNPPPPPPQSQASRHETMQDGSQNPQDPANPTMAQDGTQNPQDPANPTATGNETTQQTIPQANPSSPILPIILILLAIIGGVLAYINRKKLSKLFSNSVQEKNNSAPGKKEKFKLAKDPKEAAVAIIVMCIFVGNGIYMIVKHVQEQMYEASLRQKNISQETENNIARQQKNNLKDLSNESANTMANQDIAQDSNDIYSQTLNLQDHKNGASGVSTQNGPLPPGTRGAKASDETVEIMSKKALTQKSGKMVLISVTDSGRSNPFLPTGEGGIASFSEPGKLPFLPAPPEFLSTGSEASKVMTTVISGILFDKYSPSAIINIEGTDYLVKKGDIINRYKVLSISKEEVIVQLGNNIYKAGVGQLLSQTNLNYNTVANLNKKFGGNDVQINVKKKGY